MILVSDPMVCELYGSQQNCKLHFHPHFPGLRGGEEMGEGVEGG